MPTKSIPAIRAFDSLGTIQAEVLTINDLDIKGHPNAMPFEGTLLLLDQPSTKPPQGAQGHRILVPRAVAEKELSSLVGMAVNYKPEYDGHAPEHKIGVITGAQITGNKVEVRGIIYAKDFPDAARDIKANAPRLGMSMELADVWVNDQNARVWKLDGFKFTGGTILLKNAAAYYATSLAAQSSPIYLKALAAASAVIEGKIQKGEKYMNSHKKKAAAGASSHGDSKQQVAKVLAAAVSAGIAANLKDPFTQINANLRQNTEVVAGLVEELRAARRRRKAEASDGSDASGDMSAAAHRSHRAEASDASSDMSAAARTEPSDASGDVSDVSAAAEDELMEAARQGAKDGSECSDDSSDMSASAMQAARRRKVKAHRGRNASADASDASGDASDLSAVADASDASDMSAAAMNAFDASDPHGDSSEADAEPGDVHPAEREHARKHGTAHLHAAADKANRRLLRDLRAQEEEIAELRHSYKKLVRHVESMEAQAQAAAEHTSRQTLTPDVSMLLEKGGVNVADLFAGESKISIAQIDTILDSAGVKLDPTTRVHMKNQLLAAGKLDTGEIRRN